MGLFRYFYIYFYIWTEYISDIYKINICSKRKLFLLRKMNEATFSAAKMPYLFNSKLKIVYFWSQTRYRLELYKKLNKEFNQLKFQIQEINSTYKKKYFFIGLIDTFKNIYKSFISGTLTTHRLSLWVVWNCLS